MVTNNSWNSEDPAQVAKGGTGVATTTAYAVQCGGTTATGPFQSIASVGTSGQVLTSNGAGALPTMQAAAGDVTGPGSSTDNALARWNGTGGDTLQDSTVIVTDNGEMTNASQPAFLAYQGTTDNNVTGDGTTYTLGDTDVGTTLTEVFDQNSDFVAGASGGATFTAPVTGRYKFNLFLRLGGTTMTAGNINVVTSNRTYRYGKPVGTSTSFQGMGQSVLADMDASDTATFTVVMTDGSGKVDDIIGGATPQTWVDGVLIC